MNALLQLEGAAMDSIRVVIIERCERPDYAKKRIAGEHEDPAFYVEGPIGKMLAYASELTLVLS